MTRPVELFKPLLCVFAMVGVLAACGGGEGQPAEARKPTDQTQALEQTERTLASHQGVDRMRGQAPSPAPAAAKAEPAVSLPGHAGNWTAAFIGPESGACSAVSVSPAGQVAGSCTTGNGMAFVVNGVVDTQGDARFSGQSGNLEFKFSGRFLASSASGTWIATGGQTGAWSMSRSRE